VEAVGGRHGRILDGLALTGPDTIVVVLRPRFPLETERLLLRPFDDGDLEWVRALESRPEVVRYLYELPLSLDAARDVLARRKGMRGIDDERDALRVVGTLKETGEPVGDFGVWRLAREHLQGEIGFIVHPDHQGKGYATEAGALLLRLGFEEAGFHRICGRLDARNSASARVLERLGMRREAHLRENERIKGEWTDEVIYAILASEWAAAHGASD
jgi:RimJ/RimL family protein N-acetyltransferase